MNDNDQENRPSAWCCGMEAVPANVLLLAGGILGIALTAAAYYMWCPESPRFDGRPWRREWWKRARYHATH